MALFTKEKIAIPDLIDTIHTLIEDPCNKNNINLIIDQVNTNYVIQGLLTQLSQIFINLIQNSINALTDVDTITTGPTQNQVLSWDGSNWIPTTSTAGTTLSGLSDTTTTNASNGKILEYDNGTWIIGEKPQQVPQQL